MKPKKTTAPSNSQRDSQDWKVRFQEKLGKRIDTLEVFYQVHGGSGWEGQTIQDFIQQEKDKSYQAGFQEAVKKIREEVKDIIKNKTIIFPAGNCPSCKKPTIILGLHPVDTHEHYGFYNKALYDVLDSLKPTQSQGGGKDE